MAVTVVKNLTDIFDGASTTGWNKAPSTSNATQVTPRHSTSSISWSLGIATAHYYRTITSTDMSNGNIYWWMYSNVPDTYANGGYRIVIGDGTHARAYYVGGSDKRGHTFGSWSCMMLDLRNLPTNFAQVLGTQEPNLTAITQVGVGYSHLGKSLGGALTVHADIGRFGSGLTITGGTSGDPGTFLDIALDDASTASGKAYGIIRELANGIFGIQGSLIFGDNTGTTSTYFEENNTSLIFESNGAGNDAYNLSVVGNSTGINSFVLGEKLGSGEDALGINGVIIQSSGPYVDVNLLGTNVNILNIYGTSFTRLGIKNLILSSNSSHDFISNNIISSGKVEANQVFIRNSFFIQTMGSSSLLWNESIDIKNCNFIANDNGIEHPDSIGSPYEYYGLIFSGNTYDILNTSGNEITITALDDSNPTSYNPAESNVIINRPTLFTLTNLIPDTEIRIFRTSDRLELAGIESSSNTFTYQYNYSTDINVYVVIHKETYEYIELSNIVLTATDQSIPIQQRIDRNYISS